MFRNIFGFEIDEMFIKVSNDFVRNKESEFYFEPTEEGQLDLLVYISLMNVVSFRNRFDVNINRFVESLGYKPNTRAGKINSKVVESFDRLEGRGLLELKDNDGKFTSGTLILPNLENNFFMLNVGDMAKILDNELEKISGDDYVNKYQNKTKDLYVYLYINSYMGHHETTECDLAFYGCFPSMSNICEGCNVSEEYLRKVLSYFEFDELIFTANLGNMIDEGGKVQKSTNYYTNSIENLNGAYAFAKAYADQKNFKYSKYSKRTNVLLDEVTESLGKFEDKFKDDESKLIVFKNHFGLMLKDVINESKKIARYIDMEKADEYVVNKSYLKSKFYCKDNKDRNKYLLFIADNEMASVVTLTHIRNRIRALTYLYGIKK